MYASHQSDPSTVSRRSAAETHARLGAASTPSRNGLKRASRACCNCRLRKVKCDADITRGPCQNCREDEVECVTTESRRSRKYRLKARQLKGADPPQIDHGSGSPDSTEHHASVYLSSGKGQTSRKIISSPGFPRGPMSVGNETLGTGAQPSHESVDLPAGIRGPPQNFDPQDYKDLVAREALRVPEAALRDELLLAFVLYVHPYWPVLDLQNLLDAVYLQPDSGQCSLLLFQAVMFAGSAFVDMRLLQKMGFASRRSARKALFDKVKVRGT